MPGYKIGWLSEHATPPFLNFPPVSNAQAVDLQELGYIVVRGALQQAIVDELDHVVTALLLLEGEAAGVEFLQPEHQHSYPDCLF